MRRILAITALTLVVTASAAATAEATFPGLNGPIVFRNLDPQTFFGVPLFRAQPDGTEITELSDRPGFFTDWRADGRRIAFDFFERDNDEQIATMAPDGTDVRVITSGRGIHEIPSWSPSGRRIVFDYSPEADPSTPGFHTRLWTMRADGSHAQPLPMRTKGFDVEPRFAPNGRWIAFDRIRITKDGEQQAAFVVGTKSHRVRQLTPWHLNSEHPTWSPDSRWIIFDNPPDGTIQVIRPNGHKRHTIVPASARFGGHKPWFSPDGLRILLMCENWGTGSQPPDDYNEDICVMDADGSNIVNITNTPDTFENWPSWGPAPST